MCQNAVDVTKDAAFATDYHMKQRKLNFVAIFAHTCNLVTATEKQNNLQKITTDYGSGKVLVF
jgi:hypothetical protein